MSLWNSISAVARYFQSAEKPVMMEEFTEFWESLTQAEKVYYLTLDLETGLPRGVITTEQVPPKPFIGSQTRIGGVLRHL